MTQTNPIGHLLRGVDKATVTPPVLSGATMPGRWAFGGWPGGAWTETILHDFTGQNGDGALPVASLALSSTGVLYGTTSAGGAAGKGTVFAVKP